jgi:hypothetical protein
VAHRATTKREVIPIPSLYQPFQIGFARGAKAPAVPDFHAAAEATAVTASKTYCLCPVGVNSFIEPFRHPVRNGCVPWRKYNRLIRFADKDKGDAQDISSAPPPIQVRKSKVRQ